jgi:hypothetical protein
MDRQYNWISFYAQFANALEGFTKSENNKTAVHAFRLECDADGRVWVKVKDSAVDLQDEEWRGAAWGGQGWEVFHTTPSGFPELIQPQTPNFSQRRKDSVLHASVQKALRDRGKEAAIPWLTEVMETGHVPVHDMQPQQPGDLGPTGDIGVAGAVCRVQYLHGLCSHAQLCNHTH